MTSSWSAVEECMNNFELAIIVYDNRHIARFHRICLDNTACLGEGKNNLDSSDNFQAVRIVFAWFGECSDV